MKGLPGRCRGCGVAVWWDGWSWRTPNGVHNCPRWQPRCRIVEVDEKGAGRAT